MPKSTFSAERFITIDEAAEILGIPAWKLRRAVKGGLIRTYRILNQRRSLRLSEVLKTIEASAEGGDHE